MQITIESTDRIVEIVDEKSGHVVLARMWEGKTAAGVEVFCLISSIAAHKDADHAEFRRDLDERHQSPSIAGMSVFPLRMVI